MTARDAGPRVTLAVALVGLSSAWNAGNVGPVASDISDEFNVSLAIVGVLSGTLFLGAVVVGLIGAAQFGARVGRGPALRYALLATIAGNLLFAVSPIFLGLAVGRILPGLAFAALNVVGAVWAREAGGAFLLGVFGASIQFGIAAALLVGSVLSDLGIDWRVGFVVSAAVAAAALVALPSGTGEHTEARPRMRDFLSAAVRRAHVYRLALLFVSIYGVPMILSAWLIQYLIDDGDLTTTVAGVAAFVLFGMSTWMRLLGAQLQQRGVPHVVLSGALGIAAVGLGVLVLDPVEAIAFAGVVLVAVGFGIPYATALIEAQQLDPDAPAEPVAILTLVALVPPVVAIPLMGQALEHGDGAIAFGIMGAFVVVATLLNLRRSGISVVEDSSGESRPGSS